MTNDERTIYEPMPLDDHELCHPLKDDDFETFTTLINGMPRKASWKPIAVEVVRENMGRDLQESDAPWLGSDSLIFRRQAVDVLGSFLRQYGELLPLRCCDAELFVYNPTRIIDALDEDRSSIIRFKDGRIMYIKKYVFFENKIRNIPIFKISKLKASSTLLGRQFVDLWMSSGLRGLEFKKIWSPNSEPD